MIKLKANVGSHSTLCSGLKY